MYSSYVTSTTTAELTPNISVIAQIPTVEEKATVKVLLIDDQPIVAESIRRLLASESDIELHYCRDAQLAIPTANEVQPTVILQDLVMPDADGLMLVKFFRANPITHTIPVIVLSTRDESIVKAEAFAAGANDYLVKVPDPIEFVARLRYHSTAYANLRKRHEAEQTQADNKELERRVKERTAELKSALEDLKQTQTNLVQEEKMAGLGQLVSGVCHELNNPISFILGNLKPAQEYSQELLHLLSLYQQAYPHPTEQIQTAMSEMELDFLKQDFNSSLESIKNGAKRVSDIVLSLRNFSRLDEAEIKEVDIHSGLDSTLLLLGSKLQAINIVKEYSLDCSVRCFPGQLNQVFMHLLSNASDTIAEKLALHSQDNNETGRLYQPEITIQTQIIDNQFAQIQITDNGLGIPTKIRERIFDPFFTTKPIGHGTGLGLSISYQVITEQHEGYLECHSIPGKATSFAIKLPISKA